MTNPSSLFWEPGKETDRKLTLRLLDSPLRRYINEIGRQLAGEKALPVDWDWTKSWEENAHAGALPDGKLLYFGRLSIAIFFPFSLLLVYSLGNRILNNTCGWIAAILFASNALILLHTRRVMAEGVLVFTVLLFLWSVTSPKKSIFFIGITAALAFCAKQSSGILYLVGIIAIVFNNHDKRGSALSLIPRLISYSVIFITAIYILNPYMWKHPIQSNIVAVELRKELLSNQIESLREGRPDLEMDNFAKRASTLLVQLFFKQPDIADVGNYLDQTDGISKIYLANPLNHIMRGLTGGAVMLTLCLYGFLLGIVHITRSRADQDLRLSLFWISGVLIFLAFSSVISLPFQRYYISLIPFVCIWIGYGLGSVLQTLFRRKNSP